MNPVLTAEAMRSADRYTIDEYGISGFTLMESAGRAAADWIARLHGPVDRLEVACYCGKGNNGGDGMVVARYLHEWGARVRVVTTGDESEMSADASHNFRILQGLARQEGGLRLERLGESDVGRADLYVDGLLGTGLASDLRSPLRDLVKALNERPEPKIALDMPTGLHTNRGIILGEAVRASMTVTMGALKSGLLINDGPSCAGRVEVVDIGIPRHALLGPAERGETGCAFRTSDAGIAPLLPRRSHQSHKYSVGLALVVAGAQGMTGAPVMAASAAARAGAGYVVCACDRDIQSVLAGKLTEITTLPLPSSEDGIDPEGAIEALGERLEKASAALIGCGLGRKGATRQFIRRFLERADLPLVVDADGLNALAGHAETIRDIARGRWILTPHMGEFTRLTGTEADDLDIDDRVRLCQRFAARWDVVLLLKGMPSIVAAPNGRAWINGTGNPALASAGTGDVLAGMCAGLLAQGMRPEHAAVAALHLGGAAADRYASRVDGRTMQAMDLLDELPHVLKDRFQ